MLRLEDYTREELETLVSPPGPHVDRGAEDDCWPWLGTKDTHGYGRVCVKDKHTGKNIYVLVNRIMYYLGHPEVPNVDDLRVMNMCGMKHCGNPNHWHALWKKPEVSPEARARQKASVRRGENHARAKLDWAKVRKMRAKKIRLGKEYSLARAAEEFGCSRTVAQKVLNGETWIENDQRKTGYPRLVR